MLSPSKIIGIGSNYRRHIEEMGRSIPAQPKMFLMPPTALIGPGEAIEIPPGTARVDHEAELGVVIGRTTTRIGPADALEYVAGYTAVNDVTVMIFKKTMACFPVRRASIRSILRALRWWRTSTRSTRGFAAS